jgi:hypothetical protein
MLTASNQLGLRKDSQSSANKDKARAATPKVGRADSKSAPRGKKSATALSLLSPSPSPSKAALGANTRMLLLALMISLINNIFPFVRRFLFGFVLLWQFLLFMLSCISVFYISLLLIFCQCVLFPRSHL